MSYLSFVKETNKKTDRIRKKIMSIFKNIVFKIEITNLIFNLNEVTFNLENNTYCSYKKPNDKLIY